MEVACRGLYVHVPFCQAKCGYCGFSSVPIRQALVEAYLTALEAKVEQRARGLEAGTIYVGGGTPTAPGREGLGCLLEIISDHVVLDGVEEWTVEANPATEIEEKITMMTQGG